MNSSKHAQVTKHKNHPALSNTQTQTHTFASNWQTYVGPRIPVANTHLWFSNGTFLFLIPVNKMLNNKRLQKHKNTGPLRDSQPRTWLTRRRCCCCCFRYCCCRNTLAMDRSGQELDNQKKSKTKTTTITVVERVCLCNGDQMKMISHINCKLGVSPSLPLSLDLSRSLSISQSVSKYSMDRSLWNSVAKWVLVIPWLPHSLCYKYKHLQVLPQLPPTSNAATKWVGVPTNPGCSDHPPIFTNPGCNSYLKMELILYRPNASILYLLLGNF